ncbi:hypothetical protein AGMMS49975_21610 [Clostridia bacterium]|nr:hypothetical protein AGMMS49975_21610 [Clostridia bacterium]
MRNYTAEDIVSSIECAKNCGFEECLCVSHVDCLEQFYGVFESLDEAKGADMRSSIEGVRKQYNFLVACVMPPRVAQIVNHFGHLKLREREDGTYCFDLDIGDGRVFPIWNTKDGAYPLSPPSEREEYRGLHFAHEPKSVETLIKMVECGLSKKNSVCMFKSASDCINRMYETFADWYENIDSTGAAAEVQLKKFVDEYLPHHTDALELVSHFGGLEIREIMWKLHMICINIGSDKILPLGMLSNRRYELAAEPLLFDDKVGKFLPRKVTIDKYVVEIAFDYADAFRSLSFAFGRWQEERGGKFVVRSRGTAGNTGTDDNDEGLLDFLAWCETNAPEITQMAERHAHDKDFLTKCHLPEKYNCFTDSEDIPIFAFSFKNGGRVCFG